MPEMSRLGMRRNQAQPDTLPAPLEKVTVLGKPLFKAGLELCWQVYEAKLQSSKEACSAFVLPKFVTDKAGKTRKVDINFEACRKEIEALRIHHHKRILKIFSEAEENCYYLSWTCEPLTGTLQTLLEKSPKGITDALRYLHGTQNLMHCNLCPSSIFINIRSQWKLGGFALVESTTDSTKNKANFTGFNPKGGRNLQPDLDYIAPEVQLHHAMSPLADIFSLGMVICSIFNGGVSLLRCEGNVANYVKSIQAIPQRFLEISDRIPKPLIEPVRKMISQDVRERPTSQLLALASFVSKFYRFYNLYKKVLPLLWDWYDNHPDLQSFVVPSILATAHIAEKEDFETHLRERLCSVLKGPKSKQDTVRNAVHVLYNYLGPEELENKVFPRLKDAILENESSDLVQNAMLECIDSLVPHCRPAFVSKELLAFLASMPTANTEVVLNVASIFRRVLCSCKFHVPYTLIATELLPPLIPLLILKKLSLMEFRTLLCVVRLMLEQIDHGRTIEYSRKKSLSADDGIMDYNARSNTSYYRNLPLISMQQPTVDFSRSPPNQECTSTARPRSHSSGGLQCLRPQDKTSSNPNFGQRLSTSLLSKPSRAASWNNSITALAAPERRRSSGGNTTRILKERYSYLTVENHGVAGFLDPRRHSYEFSATSSANSLLTGGICEGPFSSSLLQSGQISRRPSAPIFGQNISSTNLLNRR
ncbi:unnamed protein product [Mesocestoides corti]|uniref:Protein kinase domain-containing protein n=1 Tax=Mesocestoides corti TaxID=53468 RepID=A0A158QU40_MESCO|nr:unnamed protein product [Mesocestoides corti]